MADTITLTNPKDKAAEITPTNVVMVFFSPFLSPDKARSNLIYEGIIRSFKETAKQVVTLLKPYIKLLKLTLPNEGDTLNRDIWVNVAKIEKVTASANGAILKLSGQKGTVAVLETKEYIDAARAQPAPV